MAEAELDFHADLAAYRTYRAVSRDAAGLPGSSDEQDAKKGNRNAHRARGASAHDTISRGSRGDAEQRSRRPQEEREKYVAEDSGQGRLRGLVDGAGMRKSEGELEPGEVG